MDSEMRNVGRGNKGKTDNSDSISANQKYNKDKEVMDNLLKEMNLFNLEVEEEDMNPSDDEGIPNLLSSTTDDNEESLFPTGIPFLNTELVGCVYSKDDHLAWPFKKLKALNRQNIEDKIINGEILELIRNGYFTKNEIMNEFGSFLVDMLFSCFNPKLLPKLKVTLIEATNLKNVPIFKRISNKLSKWFQNLGANIDFGDDGVVKERETDFVPSSQISDANIRSNIQHTIHVVINCFSKEVESRKRRGRGREKEGDSHDGTKEKILLYFFLLAQDPIVVNSFLSSDIKECIGLILELFTSEEFSLDQSNNRSKVNDLIEQIDEHWARMLPESFPHQISSYLVQNIIPISERGTLISNSLAMHSIVCTFDLEQIYFYPQISICDLTTLCVKHKDILRSLSSHKLYSVLQIINSIISRKKSLDEEDTIALRTMLQLLNAVQQKTTPSDHEEIMMKSLFRSINNQWDKKMEISLDSSCIQPNPF